MRILVTGHMGFIGTHLCKLLSKKHDITGIDLQEGNSTRDDITRYSAVEGEDYDVVIHTAAQVSVPKSVANPKYDAITNIFGTLNIIEQFPNAKFVYLSTAGLYGEGMNHKEDDPICPTSPYGLSKFTGEQYVRLLTKDALILRLANVIGPGERGEPNVMQIFERESIITMLGDGLQTRDFVHVDIVCKAIKLGLEKNLSGVYNIGTGKSKKLIDVAEFFNKEIRYAPPRKGDIYQFGLNIDKALEAGLIDKEDL